MHRGSPRGRSRRRGRGAAPRHLRPCRIDGETVPSAATWTSIKTIGVAGATTRSQPTSFGPSKVATTMPLVFDLAKAVRRGEAGRRPGRPRRPSPAACGCGRARSGRHPRGEILSPSSMSQPTSGWPTDVIDPRTMAWVSSTRGRRSTLSARPAALRARRGALVLLPPRRRRRCRWRATRPCAARPGGRRAASPSSATAWRSAPPSTITG